MNEYVRRLETIRRDKDRAFKTEPNSPIPAALRDGFRGLAYFPIDPAYRVDARVKILDNPETLRV